MGRRATRRGVLGGLAAFAGAAAAGTSFPRSPSAAPTLPDRPPPGTTTTRRLDLVAAERDWPVLGPGRPTSRLWALTEEGGRPFPVLRVGAGDRIEAVLHNRLEQHTSIHWHGVRVPNGMDGVPYLTQQPVQPGRSFTYSFDAPDPGTFFLHPHCNESGQSGRGLMAVLVVEGDERPDARSDADLVVAYKDWRLAPDGTYLAFDTPEGAGRAGTFGNVRGVNGVAGPMSAEIPAGGDVRLRLLNLDGTRIVQVGIEGADAAVIAIDGQAIEPFALDTWRAGPAMRLDILVRAPKQAGETVRLVDFGSAEPWTVATLTAAGPALERGDFAPKGLYRSGVPRADVASAERMEFTFSATSGASLATEVLATLPPDDLLAKTLLDSLCVRDTSLWAINKVAWPTTADAALPPPLGSLLAGRSYVFELVNVTPHPHPIHLHGHAFEVLSSSRQPDLPRHIADTVILNPRDRVEIAFVAAKGDWMLHCHILEHLEFGMMGYVRVA